MTTLVSSPFDSKVTNAVFITADVCCNKVVLFGRETWSVSCGRSGFPTASY